MKTHRLVWLAKGLKWLLAGVGILAALLVVCLCTLTWWLTPDRLASIVENEASKALVADVKIHNISFTLWSSFPHLDVKADSISVRSRTLDSIPQQQKKQLPPGADFLLSASGFSGGINVMDLLAGKIMLRNVAADKLRVNLVALSDSLNNFDIVPSSGSAPVPYFHVDGLKINSGSISFKSVPSDTKAVVLLKSASLSPEGAKGESRNDYSLALRGSVSAVSDKFVLFDDFPFDFSGLVKLHFKPFGVSTQDYKMNLGNVHGHMALALNLGSSPSVDKFNYRLENFTLSQLFGLLPPGDYPVLKGLQADVEINAAARLLSPYRFSSAWLPSVEIAFAVPEGSIAYTLSDGRKYEVNHVGLAGKFIFDGRDPSKSMFVIPSFYAEGLGTAVEVSGKITHLLDQPLVETHITGRADLAATARSLSSVASLDPRGDVELDADLSFRLTGHTLWGSVARLKVKAPEVSLTTGRGRLTLAGLEAESEEKYPSSLDAASLRDVPLGLRLKAAGLSYDSPADSLSIGVKGVDSRFKADLNPGGKTEYRYRAEVAVANMKFQKSRIKGNAEKIIANSDARELIKRIVPSDYNGPEAWYRDRRELQGIPHSPELLVPAVKGSSRNFILGWQGDYELAIGKASMRVPGYPVAAVLDSLKVKGSLDSLSFGIGKVRVGSTSGSLALTTSNLRQFLLSRTAAPLRMDVRANLDTLQLNQLARFYAVANPHSAIARGDKEEMARGDNTLTMMLPRNVEGHLHATASRTAYINLRFSDLLADAYFGNGRLDLDTLHLATDFGAAGLDFHYDSSDVEALAMQAAVNLDSLDVTGFLNHFPDLVERMPTLRNLSGQLGARVNARFMVFPNMCLNVPSLWADAHVLAMNMRLVQDPFVRHVTKMLLLPDETLRFADLDIHAGVHTNLLEVFPFDFEVQKYKLRVQGLNNFNGDLYYHVGVEKWPLKIPFGVNVKGRYHHPEFRFGGKGWHDGNGASVTVGVEDYDRVNVMKEFRQYGGVLVHTAATYRE